VEVAALQDAIQNQNFRRILINKIKDTYICAMKFAKHISTILLSFYLILAMGGLSIFHHMCSCSSSITSSILVENSCCSSKIVEPLSCHADAEHNSCSDGSCDDCNCETEIEILSLNETITVDQYRITESSISYSSAIKSFVSFNALNTDKEESPRGYLFDTSPPLTGQFIVILFQSLKIPSHIS
jgi:hypothetical protein